MASYEASAIVKHHFTVFALPIEKWSQQNPFLKPQNNSTGEQNHTVAILLLTCY